MSEIFISYRRDDSSGSAGAVVRELRQEFGDERVFMDVDGIKGGVDYTDLIQERLASCEVLLAVIGKEWLSLADQRGQRRIDDPEDLVRLEVATALAQDKVVVPLLVKGAQMVTKEDLPEDLQPLALRNAIEISNVNWQSDIDNLKDVLQEHLSASLRVQTRRETEAATARKEFLRLLLLPWISAALVIAPLALVRKSAEVDVQLKVDRLSFRIGESGSAAFLSAIPTASLTVQSFEWIDLGMSDLRVAVGFDDQGLPSNWVDHGRKTYTLTSAEPEWSSITFDPETEGPGGTGGSGNPSLTLDQLDVLPGTQLTLTWDPQAPLELQVRALGDQVSGRVGVPPALSVRCDRCRVEAPPDNPIADAEEESLVLRLTGDDHREIGFRGATEGSTLAFELLADTQIVKQDVLVAADLRFLRGRLPDVTSSVIGDSGTIRLVDIDRSLAVNEGEFVHLGEPESLLLRRLELDDGIAISLYGRVDDLRTGSAGFVRSRLPSLLGWIHARAAWLVYLMVIALIASTTLAFVRRRNALRKRR